MTTTTGWLGGVRYVEDRAGGEGGGDSAGEEKGTVVFCHGWPDSEKVWDQQVHFLVGKGYRCIRFCLPNFDGNITHQWGLDFDDLRDRVADIIQHVSPGRKVHLVIHDWGCVYGAMLESKYPQLIDRVVSMDVAVFKSKKSLLGTLFMIVYQWSMVFVFLTGLNFIQTFYHRLMKAPVKHSKVVATPFICYPYYYFWRKIFTAGPSAYGLLKYTPQVPHLFLYGADPKRPEFTTFHSQAWLDKLEDLKKSDGISGSVPMTRSDHWLMVRQPTETNALIYEFLQKKKKDE